MQLTILVKIWNVPEVDSVVIAVVDVDVGNVRVVVVKVVIVVVVGSVVVNLMKNYFSVNRNLMMPEHFQKLDKSNFAYSFKKQLPTCILWTLEQNNQNCFR